MGSRAIYSVADARFFLGLVAMINSLRLVGQGEPILVLDCGLTSEHVQMLRVEATVIPAPADEPAHLLKHVLPLAQPADTMLLIDADIVVTRSLDPLFSGADDSRGVAFADALPDRFDSRWEKLLSLPPVRRQTYVNTGLLALSKALGVRVLQDLRDAARHVDLSRSMTGSGDRPDYPFYFLDQDILNAIFASRLPRGELEVMEHRLVPHPPFAGLELLDERRLECAYGDGVQPFALHHIQAKPWLTAVSPNLYSRLLPRLLLADDLAIQPTAGMIPLRLRHGRLAAADRRRSAAVARWKRLRAAVGVRRRLKNLRVDRS